MDSSSSSSSAPSTSSLHLAMAAFVGASLMAVSAFYIHKRSVDQVLQRLIEIRRKPSRISDNRSATEDGREESYIEDGEERGFESDGEITDVAIDRNMRPRSVDDKALQSYRISSSLPNVASRSTDWMEEEAKFDSPPNFRAPGFSSSLDKLNFIPSGLPLLRTDQRTGEGQSGNHSGSNTRMTPIGRLMTPRSQAGNAFESIADSDEEGTEFANEDDDTFNYGNVDSLDNTVTSVYQNEGTNAKASKQWSKTIDSDNYLDVNSNLQNSSAVLLKSDVKNFIQDRMYQVTSTEAKSGVDLQGDGKVDTASGNSVKTDHNFTSIVLPLSASMHESISKEEEEVHKMIRECLDLRKRYLYREEVAPWTVARTDSIASEKKSDPFHFEPVEASTHCFRMEDGVIHVYASENDTVDIFPVASSTAFFTDMHYLLKVLSIGNVRSACHHRLRFLEEKFRVHLLLNADREFLAQKSAPHRDFYNVRKVDTHVHHSACMNQKHLLSFIKSKLKKEPDEVVIFRDGKYLTLKEVFESLDLTGHDLNVDLLDVHADKSTFHRFDKFNLKYNPCGQSRLREIFLKQDNLIQGRFLAEVTKEVLSDLEASRYQMAEYRISVYGRKQSEWDQLASWFVNNSIYSENAVWLIQLPRLYNIYKKMGIVTSFQNILDNVFIPLFEATVNPNSHPQLHLFLMQVVGFDVVDDESKPERRPTKHMPTPAEWTNEFNPAYSYYAYYCYANLYTLNKLRESKGLPTIKFRPHCGEAGDIDHLAAGFLLCHNISHGINLRKTPVLQYLYYLAQVGLLMSPLSNNSLFLDYHRNPFPMFFQRGLNVSLSSDDPLQIHLTKEPLVEEYSVAAQVWKLSACDLCEVARNSVYQSGFSHVAKSHWLGSKYFLRGPEGNDMQKTNTWKEEIQYIYAGKAKFPVETDP
ncbi:AMP deaminase, putative / myoadenylate deaminase, putative [Prunus dulcis]|uniref:AMP deaminase n=1 Tax=Prunus dulcis TaxID=3755 RepID=A0A4Y1QQP3_PRUDU|nr:AMP deaminase, putative / myoadenylate deaminase, putative [Prunus dulcis]